MAPSGSGRLVPACHSRSPAGIAAEIVIVGRHVLVVLMAAAHARSARVDAPTRFRARDARRGYRCAGRCAASRPRPAAPRTATAIGCHRTRTCGVPIEHLAVRRAAFERHRRFRSRRGSTRRAACTRRGFRDAIFGRDARRRRGVDRDLALALVRRARRFLECDVAVRIGALDDRRRANIQRHRANEQQQPREQDKRRGSSCRRHVSAPIRERTASREHRDRNSGERRVAL